MPNTTRRIERVEEAFHVRLTLPGSKSIALRHILMSALAQAPTRLLGVPRCDDVEAMFRAIVRLGSTVGAGGEGGQAGQVGQVGGLERHHKASFINPPVKPCAGDVELDLGMSGVSLRLLLGAAMLRTARTRFTGHAQLHRRPNAPLLAALEQIGCHVESDHGLLPISVTGPAEPAPSTTLKTGVSSQYLSALLLAAPCLPSGLAVHLEGELTSASYVGVTQAEMARRGAAVRQIDEDTIFVPHGQYAGGEVTIEGDASAATYHAALATLHGGTVELANLGTASQQGDYGFLTVCERAGATVERGELTTTIRGPKRLAAVGEVDMIDMPDAAPTLMALAPFPAGANAHHRPSHATRKGVRSHRRRRVRTAQDGCSGGRTRRRHDHPSRRDHAERCIRHLRRPPHGHGALGAGQQSRRLPDPRRGLRLEDLRRLLGRFRAHLLIQAAERHRLPPRRNGHSGA